VTGAFAHLSRWLERILTAGLLASGCVLAAGLLLGAERALSAGLMLLILTPVARVLAVAFGFAYARDWVFAALSFAVLAVLASGTLMGLLAAR
jgi:uncharacterized membrane protein